MNNTRGSTPPNPSLDLPNRSTGLNNTLGTIGTPHEESIAKFNLTKTCPNKRNRRNPAKSTSNPRTRKTPKLSPFTHGFGRGITVQRTTKGSHKFPPSNPQEQMLTQNPHLAPSTQQAEQASFTREEITRRASQFSLKIDKKGRVVKFQSLELVGWYQTVPYLRL
jgi:hypothetical protein